jgi:hypothetical protein
MSAILLGSHLSTPPFFRSGKLATAINLPHRSPKRPQVEALAVCYFIEHLMSDSLPTLQSSTAAAGLSTALHHGGFGSGLLA